MNMRSSSPHAMLYGTLIHGFIAWQLKTYVFNKSLEGRVFCATSVVIACTFHFCDDFTG